LLPKSLKYLVCLSVSWNDDKKDPSCVCVFTPHFCGFHEGLTQPSVAVPLGIMHLLEASFSVGIKGAKNTQETSNNLYAAAIASGAIS